MVLDEISICYYLDDPGASKNRINGIWLVKVDETSVSNVVSHGAITSCASGNPEWYNILASDYTMVNNGSYYLKLEMEADSSFVTIYNIRIGYHLE